LRLVLDRLSGERRGVVETYPSLIPWSGGGGSGRRPNGLVVRGRPGGKRRRDDFVFVDQGGAGKGFALVTVVGAVAQGRELALFGGGDFC